MDSHADDDTPHEPDELPDGSESEAILDGLIGEEMGETMASVMQRLRRAHEAWYRSEHPDEGLRERKRRLTRQLISDAATTLFASRGFDEVKVSEVARRVGVSEKTIYNYFPTKESMVLDGTDEMVETLTAALRDRAPGESITEAVVRALEKDMDRFEPDVEGLDELVPKFVEMIEATPSLHAAWLEAHARLSRVAAEELAAQARVDPRDPEPMIAGHALAGLLEVGMRARVRHTAAGLRRGALREAVVDDVRRAARLIETGLWAFNLPASARAKNQALEAARAAEEARRQVVGALRDARAAWDDARRQAREAGEDARSAAREAKRQAHEAAQHARVQAREQQQQQAAEEARRRHHG